MYKPPPQKTAVAHLSGMIEIRLNFSILSYVGSYGPGGFVCQNFSLANDFLILLNWNSSINEIL